MPRQFPLFVDISGRKIYVYGAGRIASRRVETLLFFGPCLTVVAPEASETVLGAAQKGWLAFRRERYLPGSIPDDSFFVLAATDDRAVNEAVYRECKEKGILVNVCSDRDLCDFQFPGIAVKEELVIGVNGGGNAHSLAGAWTKRIRKEVEEDGNDNQAEKASNHGKASEDGA